MNFAPLALQDAWSAFQEYPTHAHFDIKAFLENVIETIGDSLGPAITTSATLRSSQLEARSTAHVIAFVARVLFEASEKHQMEQNRTRLETPPARVDFKPTLAHLLSPPFSGDSDSEDDADGDVERSNTYEQISFASREEDAELHHYPSPRSSSTSEDETEPDAEHFTLPSSTPSLSMNPLKENQHPTTTTIKAPEWSFSTYFEFESGFWHCRHPTCVQRNAKADLNSKLNGGDSSVKHRKFGVYAAPRYGTSGIMKRAKEHCKKHNWDLVVRSGGNQENVKAVEIKPVNSNATRWWRNGEEVRPVVEEIYRKVPRKTEVFRTERRMRDITPLSEAEGGVVHSRYAVSCMRGSIEPEVESTMEGITA